MGKGEGCARRLGCWVRRASRHSLLKRVKDDFSHFRPRQALLHCTCSHTRHRILALAERALGGGKTRVNPVTGQRSTDTSGVQQNMSRKMGVLHTRPMLRKLERRDGLTGCWALVRGQLVSQCELSMGDLGKGHHQQVDKAPPLPIDSRGTRVEGEGSWSCAQRARGHLTATLGRLQSLPTWPSPPVLPGQGGEIRSWSTRGAYHPKRKEKGARSVLCDKRRGSTSRMATNGCGK